jgi:hypothetical protein
VIFSRRATVRSAQTSRVSRAAYWAAAALASLISFGNANAATLTILGGSAANQTTLGALTTPFNPNFSSADLTASTVITYFTATMNPLTQGLFVSPQNVFLTFAFVGKEAAFTNLAVSMASTLFSNNAVPGPGSSVTQLFNAGPGGGLVPFLFQSTNYNPDRVATNGGTINQSLGIAFSCVLSNVCYAFFDDGGGGVDRDWDDMVVRITATDVATTPLPASLPLFAGGLALVVLLARRRKQKRSAALT